MTEQVRSRLLVLVASTVILALTAAHYRSVYDLGFLSHDTLPIVVSSVVSSPADVVRILTEPHVGAPFWSLFYRPLLKLSFSLDHALYGFDPRGFHATSALLLAALGGALFAFARRLCGPDAVWAPWMVLAVFFVHPVHVEVHAALERRGEVLCGVFFLLALHTQLSPRALALRRPAAAPALLTLLAIASKETALVLPALVGLLVWMKSPRATARERLMHGGIASLGPAAAVGVAAAARLAVFGTLGGHDTAGLGALGNIGQFAGLLLFPQPILHAWAWVPWLPFAGAVLVGGFAFAIVRTDQNDERFRADARAALFGVGFTTILLVLHAYTGKTSRWYLLLPALGWGLMVGPALDALLHALPPLRPVLVRTLALAALVPIVAFVGVHTRLSPMVHEYAEWKHAAASRDAYLERLEPQIRAAAPGTVLRVEPFPNWVRFDPAEYARRPTVHTAAILRRDSLAAWWRIALPERNVRVVRPRDGPVRPEPDELLLVTDRRPVVLR